MTSSTNLKISIFFGLVLLSSGDDYRDRLTEGAGHTGQCEEGEAFCDSKKKPQLHVIPMVKVGHVEELEVDPDRRLLLKTVSLKPAIFEIENFLTEEESNHLINLAIKKGLKASVTYNNGIGLKSEVKVMDMDSNKKLDISEMRLTLENSFDLYFGDEDVLKLYEALSLDQNNDGYLTPDELGRIKPAVMIDWLKEYVHQHPVTQSRISKQVWLFADRVKDELFRDIQNRVQRLTKLPRGFIERSDVQVVKYGPGGHYHAHYDSAEIDKSLPCCLPSSDRQCRICRYMTVLFYLNDVEGGGGTAFPLADNATLDEQKLRLNHLINLREHCSDANLVVSPARGKAILWYNHHLDPATGWMGALDQFTWHGGCPVTRGDKWIANFWIKMTEDRDADLRRINTT